MLAKNNRAFKEWAVACDAIRSGRQTLVIRKGGIREEGGVFTLSDAEFFLLPTFEHQRQELLKPEYHELFQSKQLPQEPSICAIDTYCVVDQIIEAPDEESVRAAAAETVWTPQFVTNRFEYNPYDPVYVVLLRAYRLSEPVFVPALPEYSGCFSWVSLDREIGTDRAVPAISDEEYASRRSRSISLLESRSGTKQ